MATTKIWDVSTHVSKLLAYVANKNKTTMEIQNGFDDEEMRLAAEALGLSSDHFATEALQQAFYKVSEKLYQQANPQGGCDPNCGGNCGNDGVVDADYETVD